MLMEDYMQGAKQPQLTSMADDIQRARESRRLREAAAHVAAARVAEEEDRLVEEGPDALGADVVCEDDETVGCSRGPIGCGRWKS
mmetsp:Transcript_11941/g.43656  ORF Transcript_11941/g.43656 Transcript_11941/m.43656 type:complete len:85 (+) Transcript_11941:2174-2428(+)